MGGSDGRQETSIAAATSRVCTVAQISVPPPATTTDLRASRAAGSSAPAYVPRERFVPPWKQRALERRRASKWRQRRILAQIFGLSGGLTLFAGYVTATPSPAQIWQAVVSHITPNLDREHFRGVGQTIQALTGSFVTPNRVATRDALTRDGPSWRDATQSGSDPSARFTATVTVDLDGRASLLMQVSDQTPVPPTSVPPTSVPLVVGVSPVTTRDLILPRSDAALLDAIETSLPIDRNAASIAVVHLETGASATVNGDRIAVPASLYKVGVLVEAFRQIEAGLLRLDETLRLLPIDWAPGAGILQGRIGTQVTITDALRLMIGISDNTAAHAIVRRIGVDRVNANNQRLGLSNTRYYIDDRPDTTTAADMARLL
ncbi:MAG: serine hydrolase, partial [Proteobacteria bacterium]|nr:serine hydrolase [Pseudomonadota bacterium]